MLPSPPAAGMKRVHNMTDCPVGSPDATPWVNWPLEKRRAQAGTGVAASEAAISSVRRESDIQTPLCFISPSGWSLLALCDVGLHARCLPRPGARQEVRQRFGRTVWVLLHRKMSLVSPSDQLRAGYSPSEHPSMLDRNKIVALAMQDERWGANCRQSLARCGPTVSNVGHLKQDVAMSGSARQLHIAVYHCVIDESRISERGLKALTHKACIIQV